VLLRLAALSIEPGVMNWLTIARIVSRGISKMNQYQNLQKRSFQHVRQACA
jgi:hypothetical protein